MVFSTSYFMRSIESTNLVVVFPTPPLPPTKILDAQAGISSGLKRPSPTFVPFQRLFLENVHHRGLRNVVCHG